MVEPVYRGIGHDDHAPPGSTPGRMSDVGPI